MKENENGPTFKQQRGKIWEYIGQLNLLAHYPFILENRKCIVNPKNVQYNLNQNLEHIYKKEHIPEKKMNALDELLEKIINDLETQDYKDAAKRIEKLEEKILKTLQRTFKNQNNQ